MKIKLDRYDLSILINGLNSMREQYCLKTNDYLFDLILRLIDIYDHTMSKRKARILFNSDELHMIFTVLIDWRNLFISTGYPGAAEGVGELLVITRPYNKIQYKCSHRN